MSKTIYKCKYKITPHDDPDVLITDDNTYDIQDELELLMTPISFKRTISWEETKFNKLYSKYAKILENVPTFSDNKKIINTKLYKIVLDFLQKNKIDKILLSLSGGVDSMVLLEIIDYINNTSTHNILIYCCHINYNNREETNIERDFLRDYCETKDIYFECLDIKFKRDDTKRAVYENKTREIRYNYYMSLCDLFGCSGVLLGHHKDDICENIFNNIMKGSHDISDLKVIKEVNNIMGVTVYRPMLSVYKDEIYNIAYNYNIPFFLDTTPDWCCRGKMRTRIFPQCEDCYGNDYKENLIKVASDSEKLGNLVNDYIINDIFKLVIYDKNSFTIPFNKVLKEIFVLKVILKQICYKLNVNIMKEKNITTLCKLIDNNYTGRVKMSLFHTYDIVILSDTINFNCTK